jgi:uncharacterized protein YfdQ (DUF2303 family)
MTNWYSEVARNLDKIPDCINYFDTELQNAKKEVRIYGNLEKASAALPGIVEHRFNQLQQIEAILEYLNIELRRTRSKAFKKFLENYNRALSSRDAEKYVDGEQDVVDMDKIINEFKLRVAGMEDANIK